MYKNQNRSKILINQFYLESVKPGRLTSDSNKSNTHKKLLMNRKEPTRTESSTNCLGNLSVKPGRLLPNCTKTLNALHKNEHTPVIETVLDEPTLSRDGSMRVEKGIINHSVQTKSLVSNLCSTCTRQNCTYTTKRSKKEKMVNSHKKNIKNDKKFLDKIEQEEQNEKENKLPEIPIFRTKEKENRKTMKMTSLNKQRKNLKSIEKKSEAQTSLNTQRNLLNDSTEHSEAEASLNIQRNSLNDSAEHSEAEASLNIQRNSLNLLESTQESSDLGMNIQRNHFNQLKAPTEDLQQNKFNISPYNIDVSKETHLLNIQRNTSLNDVGQKSENSTKNQKIKHNKKEINNKENTYSKKSSSETKDSSSEESETNSFSSEASEENTNPFKYFSKEFYTVLYTNIDQSITGKLNELKANVEKHKPDIIMITEIEPKVKNVNRPMKESEINIPNYHLYVNQERKRGIAMYINKKLNPRECTDEINKKFEECVFCEFEGANKAKFLIGCMYKSPNSSKENIERMLETIKNEELAKYDIICIAGDFNYPKIKWDNEGKNAGENEIFVECIKDAYLFQKVNKPTRNVRMDQQANIVDLVLVNDTNAISEIIHTAPIGASDHDCLYFQLQIQKKEKKEESKKRFNLGKGDYKKMRKNMNKVDWKKIEKLEVDEAWNFTKEKIIENMEKCIPKTKIKEKINIKPCWMNDKVFRKIKKKYHAYKRFLVTKQGRDYEKYIRQRNICSKEIKKAKKKHERNIAKDCKENPSKFWRYVNEKCKTNVGVSSLKDENGNLVTSDKDRAEILNKFFTSVFLKEDYQIYQI